MAVLAPVRPGAQPVAGMAITTLAQWDALPEDDGPYRSEVCEGRLVMAAAPQLPHQTAVRRLADLLERKVGSAYVLACDVDVVLAHHPLTIRRPDVVVLAREAISERLGRFPAYQVRLAVEILSPGNRRVDLVIKRGEYAQSGIPEYWVLDVDEPSLQVFRLPPGDHVGGERGRRYVTVSRQCGLARVQVVAVDLVIDLAGLTRL